MPKFFDVNRVDHADATMLVGKAVGGLNNLTLAQGLFSFAMFGTPDVRGPSAVLDHVRKEVEEIALDPMNRQEWADLAILALDGLQRACWLRNRQIPKGGTVSGQDPADVIREKMVHNFDREWPALDEQDPTRACEHVRTDAEQAEKVIELSQVPMGTPHPCTRPQQLQSPVSNGTQAELNMWAQQLRDVTADYGFSDVQQLLVAAGLVRPDVPGTTYRSALEFLALHYRVHPEVVQQYMNEASRNTLPAYRADMAQRIAVESVIRKAGYNDLLTFVLTALAELGHVVPEATDEGDDE